MVATGARIQCSAQAPGAFVTNLQAAPLHSDSIAVRQGAELAATSPAKLKNPNPVPSTPHSQIRRRRPADMFAKSSPLLAPKAQDRELICDPTILRLPLISIGPNTNAALDQLELGDEILPKLRALARTVRSSRWEAVFMSPKWNLAPGHAAILSNALLADLQVGIAPFNPDAIILKVRHVSFFTSLFSH